MFAQQWTSKNKYFFSPDIRIHNQLQLPIKLYRRQSFGRWPKWPHSSENNLQTTCIRCIRLKGNPYYCHVSISFRQNSCGPLIIKSEKNRKNREGGNKQITKFISIIFFLLFPLFFDWANLTWKGGEWNTYKWNIAPFPLPPITEIVYKGNMD